MVHLAFNKTLNLIFYIDCYAQNGESVFPLHELSFQIRLLVSNTRLSIRKKTSFAKTCSSYSSYILLEKSHGLQLYD